MSLYRHINGSVWDIDLDAAGPNMRAIYDAQIAAGELIAVDKPAAKKTAAKKAAPAPDADA